MKKAIDVNDLEAQFLKKLEPIKKSFIIESEPEEEEELIEFDDFNEVDEPTVIIPVKKNNFSYASSVGNNIDKLMTVEELESEFRNSQIKCSQSKLVCQSQAPSGPPPGLPPGLSSYSLSSSKTNTINAINVNSILPSSSASSNNILMSSTGPLPKNDPNREFMNRFERNLIMKIHTTQLTTETPLMDDFYYQALTRKKANLDNVGGNDLLYFPLPSAAERQRELQRREKRRRQREKEHREKEKEKDSSTLTQLPQSDINADLVLGKVSNSSSRKPRQQLQVPSDIITDSSPSKTSSLHESVLKGIESVYNSILAVEDFYLIKEEIESRSIEDGGNVNSNLPNNLILPNYEELLNNANATIFKELNLNGVENGASNGKESSNLNSNTTNIIFIHFLTIPKGRSIISRILKLLNDEGKNKFLKLLIEHFDFLEIVRPETKLSVVDSFISQVLSPLVEFIGDSNLEIVMESLNSIYSKRSFIWIALTKCGIVLLCILLSRLEILKSTGDGKDEDLIEKIHDSLEGHFLELFSPSDPNRDFYSWQFLALLAMNVESDRKRSMILELRDKILLVVEESDEKSIKNLNVFLNALGLDSSQLK